MNDAEITVRVGGRERTFTFEESGHLDEWPRLIIIFSQLLKELEYDVPVDLVEKYMHNGIIKEYEHILEFNEIRKRLYKEEI
jgi:hypothetical protein